MYDINAINAIHKVVINIRARARTHTPIFLWGRLETIELKMLFFKRRNSVITTCLQIHLTVLHGNWDRSAWDHPTECQQWWWSTFCDPSEIDRGFSATPRVVQYHPDINAGRRHELQLEKYCFLQTSLLWSLKGHSQTAFCLNIRRKTKQKQKRANVQNIQEP